MFQSENKYLSSKLIKKEMFKHKNKSILIKCNENDFCVRGCACNIKAIRVERQHFWFCISFRKLLKRCVRFVEIRFSEKMLTLEIFDWSRRCSLIHIRNGYIYLYVYSIFLYTNVYILRYFLYFIFRFFFIKNTSTDL